MGLRGNKESGQETEENIKLKVIVVDEIEDMVTHIEVCENNGHTQQVVYSTYHRGITQICWDEQVVRTNIDVE